MPRLNIRTIAIGFAALGVLHSAISHGQDPVQLQSMEIPENWYKTELLIFVRDPALARPSGIAENADDTQPGDPDEAELWDPKPSLAYPADYRFLVDEVLADKRLAENAALGSRIDEHGVQHLEFPFPIEELLRDERPDALIEPMPILIGDDSPLEPNTPPEPNMPLADSAEILPPDPNQPLLALPYQAITENQLDFRRQADSLRRRGHRVLFHSAWWSQLNDAAKTLPIAVDRAGDEDSSAWPELQGSVHLYRSRFLHLGVDLWLNTLADYLPWGWQIEPPPLAKESVIAETPAGERLMLGIDGKLPAYPPADKITASPGMLSTLPDAGMPSSAMQGASMQDTAERDDYGPREAASASNLAGAVGSRSPSVLGESRPAGELSIDAEPEDAKPYPWKHAITHRQTRRMRSGEIHYLDHPVIGVIVRIVPASEESVPFVRDRDAASAFRGRHGLMDPTILELEPN